MLFSNDTNYDRLWKYQIALLAVTWGHAEIVVYSTLRGE